MNNLLNLCDEVYYAYYLFDPSFIMPSIQIKTPYPDRVYDITFRFKD